MRGKMGVPHNVKIRFVTFYFSTHTYLFLFNFKNLIVSLFFNFRRRSKSKSPQKRERSPVRYVHSNFLLNTILTTIIFYTVEMVYSAGEKDSSVGRHTPNKFYKRSLAAVLSQ